jgi:hypothetical protein
MRLGQKRRIADRHAQPEWIQPGGQMPISANRLRQPCRSNDPRVGDTVMNDRRFGRRRPLFEDRAGFGVNGRRVPPVLFV